MSIHNLVQSGKVYWGKRLIRILVAVLVVVGAIVLQYRLANIPLPVEVEKSTPPYTPVAAALIKREELIIDNPSRGEEAQSTSDIPTEVLPADGGTEGVQIDAHFDSARLGDDNMKRLRRESEQAPKENPPPPEGLQQIDYTSVVPAASPEGPGQPPDQTAKPCRAAISIALADNTKLPSELHFFQPDDPVAGDRSLEIKAVGADLIVQMSVLDATNKFRGPGCGKTISVGDEDWHRSFAGGTLLQIVVPAGTSFQVWFSPLPKQNPWSGASDFFEPFKLVVSPPLRIGAIRRTTRDGSPSIPPTFNASSEVGGQPLLLKHLRIGSEELQLDFSGKAMVQENGKYAVTFDLWAFARKNSLLAGILAMLDVALLEGLRRFAFNSKAKKAGTKSPRRRSKKKEGSSGGRPSA
jgi:hypothetical protein